MYLVQSILLGIVGSGKNAHLVIIFFKYSYLKIDFTKKTLVICFRGPIQKFVIFFIFIFFRSGYEGIQDFKITPQSIKNVQEEYFFKHKFVLWEFRFSLQ